MITAYGTMERAVEAMKQGAYDFITRPFEPDHIALVVRKALEQQRLKRGVEILSEEIEERYRLIVGESAGMKDAVDLAKKAAASSATVLLLGESGTGKEIFARFIHNHSERKTRPFIAINSVGLSRELLESELFGHEQGAFTGAHRRKTGKIELADRGTIFFDEIGDVSQELQAKLLRFLQEREFERVGGVTPISVDVRIIAATNRDLERSVKEEAFRKDLYYRLNVVVINLPPLRQRREDIAPLCEYFLRKHSAAIRRNVTGISEEAQRKLEAYEWPGNVREPGQRDRTGGRAWLGLGYHFGGFTEPDRCWKNDTRAGNAVISGRSECRQETVDPEGAVQHQRKSFRCGEGAGLGSQVSAQIDEVARN